MFVDGNEELIAAELGITEEELQQLSYDEGAEESADGGMIYNYWMTLRGNNPPEIVAKIKGLQGNTVRFQPHIFDHRDPDDTD